MNVTPLLIASLLCLPAIAQEKHPPKSDKPAPADKVEKTDKAAKNDKVEFAAQVLPILEKNCMECHRSPYVGGDGKLHTGKGGVVLDGKDALLKSRKGKFVVAGKPDASEMIHAITLPADHEDRMPPAKHGEPLAKEQIEVLKKWVSQGAEIGDWKGLPLPEGARAPTKEELEAERNRRGNRARGQGRGQGRGEGGEGGEGARGGEGGTRKPAGEAEGGKKKEGGN